MQKKKRSTTGMGKDPSVPRGKAQRSTRKWRSSASTSSSPVIHKDRQTRHPTPQAQLFASLFETSPDAGILVNEDRLIIAANQAAERLFGYTRNEMSGMPIDRLVPEAEQPEHNVLRKNDFKNPRPRGMAEAQAERLELYARLKDGTAIPVEISLNPVQSSMGWIVHCVVRDTRQRLLHTHDAQMQNGLVRLLQEVAIAANEARSTKDVFVFTLDKICRFLRWQFGHAVLFREGGIEQQHFWSSNVAEDFSIFRAVTEALPYAPGEDLNGQVFSTGQPAWYSQLSSHPKFRRRKEAIQAGLNTGMALPILVDKTVVGVLEFFHTQEIPPNSNLMAVLPHISLQLGRVVERDYAEKALRKSANQMRMLITSLPVLLWLIDREGRLLMLEGKSVATAGLQPETLIGQNLFQILDTRPDLLAPLHRALNGEEVHLEMKADDGSVFEMFYTPSYDASGNVEAAIGLALDVSERKRIETELEEVKHRLLENIDTDRARLAQQLHDGPLQDLYGAYYQIQEIKSELDDAQQETANRALQTIQAVNATLRVICGELHPDTLVHLGLQKAMRSHVDRMQERQPKTQIELELDNDQNDLPHATRLGLYRVYQQLVSNAAVHADAQHIWVRLHMAPEEAKLEVQDDGKGFEIPKRWVDLVRKGQLGLVSTVERVHGMDGSIEILSRPEQGTTVRVKVPIRK